MRWTFDGVEFFRYVEKEEPAATSFPSSGVQVDVIIDSAFNLQNQVAHSLTETATTAVPSCSLPSRTAAAAAAVTDAQIKLPQCHDPVADA